MSVTNLSAAGMANPVQPRLCSAKTCSNEIGDSDRSYPFPSGSRGITWQELLLGAVHRHTGALIVCSSHFSERQYTRGKNGRKYLAKNAFPDVNILSNGGVCRFCMEPSKVNMYPLFNNRQDVPSLEDIERTVNIRIRQDDGLPQVSCATCLSKVRYIKRIQDQFQESDRALRARLNIPDNQPNQASDDEPAMEEEYLLEPPQKPTDQDQDILLTADQLTIVEGAQEEIETSEARQESPPATPQLKTEESTECVMLFTGDIQESTTDISTVEYDMTDLCTDGTSGEGGADSEDEDEDTANAKNDDSDDQELVKGKEQKQQQSNGNPYKPFRYSKRARRE